MRQKTFATACSYVDAGFSVIPIRTDGTKSPLGEWDEFKKRKPTCKELHRWFSHGNVGIALITGLVSGGLEVIDFDCAELFEPWRRSIGESLASKLTIVKSPSGWHCYYRCSEIGHNKKIATDPNRKKQTLIETKAEGGYIVAPGSPGACHPTGRQYLHWAGPPLTSLSVISPIERKRLWAAARVYDKRPEAALAKIKARANGWNRYEKAGNSNDPAEIRFVKETFTWAGILLPHGWTSYDGITWTRPGKSSGCSAKIAIADDGTEILVVFSTNAGVLASDGEPRKINKFEAWKWLECGGNGSLAFQKVREAHSV